MTPSEPGFGERRTIGGLEIAARLSTGGVGEVFLAKRLGPHGFQKLAVVKTLRADLEHREDLRRMFFDEARLVARLDHSAICQVYEFGEDDGTLFMVMEHVAGVTLAELMARLGGPCPPLVAARIAEEAARGLHAAHEARDEEGVSLGVVHRDVSPANLMLTFRGRVKIVDFGIALARDRTAPVTQVGTVRGKYAYIAPEQMRPGVIDRRADVFALAVVLYELLAGRPLFESHARFSARSAGLVISPPCEGLEEIVFRGLELEPGARFQSAAEMADALSLLVARYGGETLEQFAARALSDAREVPVAPQRGPTLVEGEAPPPDLVTPRPKRTWRLPAAVVSAVSVGAVATFLLSPREVPKMIVEDHPPAVAEPEPELEPQRPAPAAELEQPVPEITRKRVSRAPKKHARPETAAVEPEPEREPGEISVGADPYMLIVVDGRDLGLTPIIHQSIAAGTHRVDFLDPSTRKVLETRVVDVSSGQHKRVLYHR